jgi:serine/threonine protein kinase
MRTQRQSPVERLCAELAESWRMGRRPELRGFLERLAPDERSSGLVRLLRVELQARRERGEEASEEEYRQQYPEEAEAISLAFSTRGQTGVNTEVEVEWSVATPVPNMFEPTQIDPAQQPSRVEDESPWEPGMMLGGFRLEKMLGRGGFGEVWKGLDTRLGWDVAIKLLRPKHLNTEHQRTFFEEARKLAAMRLQGARVLEVLGANETEGWPYLVTRYLSGGTLRGQMRERPRDWQEASRVVADLAETLQMTHRQQIYHRDIKPENVLLDERGQVYLADFGLATSEDQQVREGLAIGGTWAYAAPEQCLQGISGGRTDIYALGVLFYEWLTGRCPGPSERDLHVRWLQQPTLRAQPPRELNEDVPEELQEICLAMIEKDFDQRKITAGDVARRLRRVLAPEHSAAASLIESQKSRVSGRLVGTVGVALLGCLGAVALWSAGTGDGPDMGRGRGPDAEQGAEAGRGEPPANPPAVAGSSGERPSEPEEPLPSMARGLIQPLGQRSHLIRWKGGLELTPGLLDFPSRRPQRQFLVVPDGDTLMLQSEYPQFLPLALSLDHQLREVSWEMETDQWLGFGFFYNFRPSVGPDSAAEFAALMFFTTHPPELLPEVYAVHRQFRIDPTRGLVEDLGGQDHTRLFAERPAPQTFRIRFRFREGRLASILVNDELYAIPEGTLPMNDLVGGPLGVVLRRGHVVLSQPKLEFEP